MPQRSRSESRPQRACTGSSQPLHKGQGLRVDLVHDWFAEGLDTADLKDAKALLDELSS